MTRIARNHDGRVRVLERVLMANRMTIDQAMAALLHIKQEMSSRTKAHAQDNEARKLRAAAAAAEESASEVVRMERKLRALPGDPQRAAARKTG